MPSETLSEQHPKLLALGSRVLVWGVIFGVLLALRSFFLLIFLTFAFAFIQGRAVVRLSPYIGSRTLRVWLVGISMLALLSGAFSFLAPSIKEQASVFATNYSAHVARLDREVNYLLTGYPALRGIFPLLRESAPLPGSSDWSVERSSTALLLKSFLGETKKGLGTVLEYVRDLGAMVLRVLSAFFLALLFSFLIILDLPSLSRGVVGLRDTKLGDIYDEVMPSVARFGLVVGQALEAQFFVALLNTVLTGIGLTLLGLTDHTSFLLVVVFLCGFIPIAGMFISSFPICLLALQDGGPLMMALSAVMILIIHFIEAYILNPRIFGHHLKINPVLALIILTLGGKLFGIWGFVLGLPVCTYIFKYAIRHNPPPLSE